MLLSRHDFGFLAKHSLVCTNYKVRKNDLSNGQANFSNIEKGKLYHDNDVEIGYLFRSF